MSSIAEHVSAVKSLRAYYQTGVTRPAAWRKKQLQGLISLLKEKHNEFFDAVFEDMRRPKHECVLAIGVTLADLENCIAMVDQWMLPTKYPTPPNLQMAKSFAVPEPLGVVLVLSPWNYPSIAAGVLGNVLIAGNCVCLKPAELSSACARFFATYLPKYVDPQAVKVILTETPAQTSELLNERFDKIHFTGGLNTARIIQAKAAKFVTPVDLELGGKCPVIVNKDTNLDVTVNRLCSVRFINSGQTCIAPEYVLVHEEIYSVFQQKCLDYVNKHYVSTNCKDLGRIISSSHFQRLQGLLADHGGKVLVSGTHDAKQRLVHPTILLEPRLDSRVMKEECFGPILCLFPIASMDKAIDFVNNMEEKPLALYLFTYDQAVKDKVVAKTSAGGVNINDCGWCFIFLSFFLFFLVAPL